ncbi:MAG: homogentisate 1,2-dioxygenase [Gammaproteobacteria bacterium]
MAKWISIPKSEGKTSRQAHADLPENSFERELGKEGFYGPATQMYHQHPPTAWKSIDGPLKPRAFDTNKISVANNSPWDAVPLLGNDYFKFRIWKTDTDMNHLVRNGDGDELLFVHLGKADLFCDYGHIHLSEGDYFVLPRGTMWRIETNSPLSVLLLESTNTSYQLPEKGLLGNHAIFDPAVLDTPKLDQKFTTQQVEEEWNILVKRRGMLSTLNYSFNPLDAIGWHGTLMPVRLNWRDIRPVMSHRYHIPPSAHTTFLSKHFIVCTFTPRPLESDPGALRVPFYHNNDDYDEIIFYHRGDFFSRDNIHPGMITLHPSGVTHGPHPKAFAMGKQRTKDTTDEVAIMIDSREGVDILPQTAAMELKEYADSWQ